MKKNGININNNPIGFQIQHFLKKSPGCLGYSVRESKIIRLLLIYQTEDKYKLEEENIRLKQIINIKSIY